MASASTPRLGGSPTFTEALRRRAARI
jgi:hypothetical protein